MPRLPKFQEPSTYIKYVGPVFVHPKQVVPSDASDVKLRFVRVLAREAPLKYVRTFANVGPGTVASGIIFGDLEQLPSHILQCFIGVSYGGRLRVFHPQDQRILKWDDQSLEIQERDTANIEWEDSPVEDPKFELWVAPTINFVPQLDAENVLSHVVPRRNIDIQVFMLAAKYTYEFVEKTREADIYEKLVRHQIPSKYVTFGGKI